MSQTSGTNPRTPDTKSILFALMAWEYGPNAAGAFSVWMASFIPRFVSQCNHYEHHFMMKISFANTKIRFDWLRILITNSWEPGNLNKGKDNLNALATLKIWLNAEIIHFSQTTSDNEDSQLQENNPPPPGSTHLTDRIKASRIPQNPSSSN